MADINNVPTFASALDAALRYAARGWPVFPCRPDKKPYTEHGFREATTEPEQIDRWWRRWPDAQVAVACGAAGICVIDLDLGKGKDGVAAYSRVKDDRPDWCELAASTPRGGRHLVYLMPDPPVSCTTDLVQAGSGIDVRADGGYIVVPSPASPGREWAIGSPWDVDDDGCASITSMPEWLEQLVRGGRRSSSTSPKLDSGAAMPLSDSQLASIRRALAYVDSNPRDTWIRVGMALKSTGARDQAYELWCEWSRTSPKFDAKDQRYQWDSLRELRLDGSEITIATLFHLAKQAGYTPSVDEEVAAIATPPAEPPPRAAAERRPFPEHLMNVPGLLGDIAEWMVRSSTRQQKAMCLASAIVTLGAVFGRRVATPTDLRTNVYALGIGETACGKDPGIRLPHLLLTRANLQRFVGPGEWKSDSGLRAALQDEPAHACYVDEFTKLLDQMSGRNVPGHVKGIKKHLLDLWGASNSVHLAPGYANRVLNKPVVIEQPNLCLYGTGVPSELFSSLDRGAMADGFLNRMLIFFADQQQPKRQRVGRAEPPAELVARLVEVDKMLSAEVGNLAGLATAASAARMVPMDDDALQLLEQFESGNDERIRQMRGNPDLESIADLWVRAGANAAKLALIRSVGYDPQGPTTAQDVAWATELVVWCTERTMAEVEARVADSQQEAQTKRVLRLIVAAGPAGITASQLCRKTQWLRRGDRKDMIATLIESGQVEADVQQVDRGTRGAVELTTYRATVHNASNASSGGLEALERLQAG